jgi:hypothetical protein
MTLLNVLPGELQILSSLGPCFGLDSSVIQVCLESRDRVTIGDKVKRLKPKRDPSELEIYSPPGSTFNKVIH